MTATATLSAESVTAARALAVSAVYLLSEAGRKASLLSGGNGRAVQQIQVHLPVNRLHGTSDQQARQTVGMLPMDEAVEAMTDDAFRALAGRSPYVRDGADRLQVFLRRFPQHHDVVINGFDLAVSGRNAGQATRSQWALLQEIQAVVPDANVTLRVREISWKCDHKAPQLTLFTVLVTKKCGAVSLRREFLASSE